MIKEQFAIKDARDLINDLVALDETDPKRQQVSVQLAKTETEILKCRNSLTEMNMQISNDLESYFSKRENQMGCMKV